MNGRLAIEEEVAALKRIVALLFSLANLAESAAGRSPAVRALVLWLLRYAETVARDFVASDLDMAAPLPLMTAGNRPEDAMRLAASLRALAMQVDLLASLAFAAGGAHFDDADPLRGALTPAMRGVLNLLSAPASFARRAAHPTLALDTS